MVDTSTFWPLKENEEVLAATCSCSRRESELRSSSLMPSEKYSCFGSPLMFTNGSTAMEGAGGAKTTVTPSGFTVEAPAGLAASTRTGPAAGRGDRHNRAPPI